MLRVILPLLVVASSVHAACIGIQGREIVAGDLAKLNEAFSKLDAGMAFSYAPPAGAQRNVAGSEIDRWAAGHGLEGMHNPDVCFERITHPLTLDEVAHAVAGLLGTNYQDLRIEVIEVCRCQIEPGRIDFSLEGVSAPPTGHPETPMLWRGRVIAANATAYPIWARVRVLASINVIRATGTLRAGRVITRQDLETITLRMSPFTFRGIPKLADYEGKIMNTSVGRGSILQPSFVHSPSDVERGSLVAVTVSNGSAYLALEARAETAGNIGENITLRNPMGAARFRAIVTGRGEAEVILNPQRVVSPRLAPVARQIRTADSGGGL